MNTGETPKTAEKGFFMEHYDEAVQFYNENYSGTEMSEFLKPYIIYSYIYGKKSANSKVVEALKEAAEVATPDFVHHKYHNTLRVDKQSILNLIEKYK